MSMILDALRSAWRHRFGSALGAIGIALAVALTVTVASLHSSLLGSIDRFSDQLAQGADVEVLGNVDGGVTEELAREVLGMEGVGVVVPMLTSQVIVDGERTILVGVDERVLALKGVFSSELLVRVVSNLEDGRLLFGPAFDAEMATVHEFYTAASGHQEISSAGVIEVAEARSFNGGRFVVTNLEAGRRLLHLPDRADSLFVVGDGSRSAHALASTVKEKLGGRAAVAQTGIRVDQVSAVADPIRLAILLAGSASFAIAGVLIFDAVAIGVERRRRELAVLRTIGATSRQLMLSFMLESSLVAIFGAVLGASAGLIMARITVSQLPPFLVSAFGVEIGFLPAWWSIPLTSLLGLVIAVTSAGIAARRITIISPAEAVRSADVSSLSEKQKSRLFLGGAGVLSLVLAALFALFEEEWTGVIAVMLVIIGIAGIASGVSSWFVAGATALAVRLPRIWLVTEAALRSSHRRTAVCATVIGVALTLVVMTDGLARNQVETMRATLEPLTKLPLLVDTSSGDEAPANVLFPDSWTTELDELAGVTVTGSGQFTFVIHKNDRVLFQGVSGPTSLAPVYALADTSVRDRIFDENAVIISTQFADRFHVREGSSFVLRTPSGPHTVEVVDIVPSASWPNGLVATSLERAQSWYARPGVSFIELAFDGTVPEDAAVAAVKEFTGQTGFPVYVVSGALQVDRTAAATVQATAALRAIELVVLIVMALVVLNAQVSMIWQRRREFALLRAIGGRPGYAAMTVLVEVAAVTLGAALLGAIGGVWAHRLASSIAESLSGFPVFYKWEFAGLFLIIPLTVVVACAGAAFPAYWVAKIRGVDAFSEE